MIIPFRSRMFADDLCTAMAPLHYLKGVDVPHSEVSKFLALMNLCDAHVLEYNRSIVPIHSAYIYIPVIVPVRR